MTGFSHSDIGQQRKWYQCISVSACSSSVTSCASVAESKPRPTSTRRQLDNNTVSTPRTSSVRTEATGPATQLCDDRVHAAAEEVAQGLRGNWHDGMLFELSQARESYRFAQQQIQSCDHRLESGRRAGSRQAGSILLRMKYTPCRPARSLRRRAGRT